VLTAISKLDVGPSHIDVGRLAVNYYDKNHGEGLSIEEYVRAGAGYLIGSTHKPVEKPVDVVLYGFGRIGRLMARILIDKTDGGDAPAPARHRRAQGQGGERPRQARQPAAPRLGARRLHGTIRVDEERESFVANGNEIKVIYADSPDSIDYTAYGIDDAIVIDNTGVWRDEAGLSQHLKSKGVAKVILTAPGKGDLKNMVAGINNDHHRRTTASSPRRPAPPTPSCRRSRPSTTSSVSSTATSRPCTPIPTTRT
jgi:glyceraldehyde 3-phosphate dehydrogenase